MTLTEILYGRFTPPPTCGKTIRHSVMARNGRMPKPYTAPPPRANQLLEESEKAFEYIKVNPGSCCKDLSEALGKHISYTYRLRDILLEQGRVETVRGKPIKRGGPKTTLFYARGSYAG